MNPTSNFFSTSPGYTTSNPNTTYSSSAHPVTTGNAGIAAGNPNYAGGADARTGAQPVNNTTTTTGGAAIAADPNYAPDGTSRIGQPTSAGHSAVSGIKGVFAGIHGAGETIRGTFNSAVDELAGDRQGKVKNDNVTVGGVNEMETGDFTVGTKNREGAIPGDGEKRF